MQVFEIVKMKVGPNVGKRRSRRFRRGRKSYSSQQQKTISFHSPPIWFKPDKLKQTAEAEGNSNKGKEERKEIELLLDPEDKDSGTIKKKVLVLRNPDPESWITWLMEFEEVCNSAPIKGAKLQAISALQFLAGLAKETWQKNYATAVAANTTDDDSSLSKEQKLARDEKVLQETITACSKAFFHMEQPERKQKHYMRYGLSTESYTIREFSNRLVVLNNYLRIFHLNLVLEPR